MIKWILFIFIFVPQAWADDQLKSLAGFDPKVDIIADNYETGAFLIYDCKEKHWVCVTAPYYKECEESRKADETQSGTFHSCAPVGEFPTKKSCFQRQLYMTTHNHGARFCIKDEWKVKAVK